MLQSLQVVAVVLQLLPDLARARLQLAFEARLLECLEVFFGLRALLLRGGVLQHDDDKVDEDDGGDDDHDELACQAPLDRVLVFPAQHI